MTNQHNAAVAEPSASSKASEKKSEILQRNAQIVDAGRNVGPLDARVDTKSRREFIVEALDRAIKTGLQFALFYAGITATGDFTNVFELKGSGVDVRTALEYFGSGVLLSLTSSFLSGLTTTWREHSMLTGTRQSGGNR